jgi:hypothetical protein
VDPLILLDQAVAQGKVPHQMAKRVRVKMAQLGGAVMRVESASGLTYPQYYVEPTLPVARGGGEYGQVGVYFARVIPTTATGTLTILIQFTAALVALATKATVEAVAAHEFTHYVELVRKLASSDVVSDESASTMFEASYADSERTIPPKLLFTDSRLVGLITRKFKPELTDPALTRKVAASWIDKGLPVRLASLESNAVKLEMSAVARTEFDPAVVKKAAEIEEKMRN